MRGERVVAAELFGDARHYPLGCQITVTDKREIDVASIRIWVRDPAK